MMERRIIHLDVCPSQIAREWYKRGKEESDTIYKFVSLWIAFNQLYNYRVYNLDAPETRRIRDYCKAHIGVLADTISFTESYMDPFIESPVISIPVSLRGIDWRRGKEEITDCIYSAVYRGIEDENKRRRIGFTAQDYINICNDKAKVNSRIYSLFQMVYKVRCNLFHGMKMPNPGRDYELVKSSAEILENCLPELIEDTFWN